MKTLNYLKKHLVLALIATTMVNISCKAQGGDDVLFVDLSDMKIDLSELRLGQELVLFEFEDTRSISDEMNNSIENMIEDAMEIINEDNGTSNIVIGITIENGKAVINSVAYYEFERVAVKYDKKGGGETASRAAFPISTLYNIFAEKACPPGYTQVGTCGNLGNVRDCLGDEIRAFMETHISTIGDCASVTVQVGTLRTKVCGRGC
jgi:hypothetical protein